MQAKFINGDLEEIQETIDRWLEKTPGVRLHSVTQSTYLYGGRNMLAVIIFYTQEMDEFGRTPAPSPPRRVSLK